MTPALVVLGDVVLDVDVDGEVVRHCPDAPQAPVLDVSGQHYRPGAAALAALLAATGDVPVRLVTALAADAAAETVRGLLTPRVDVVACDATGATAVKCRLRVGGRTLCRVDHGADRVTPTSTAAAVDALDGACAILVSDYGRGLTADPALRQRLLQLAGWVPVVWDPHPRGSHPVGGCALVTPNLAEAVRAAGGPEAEAPGRAVPDRVAAQRAASRLRTRWRAENIAVTLGAQGALLRTAGTSRLVPAPLVASTGSRGTDPCGAGDRFAASAALALLAGCPPLAAVRVAVAEASSFVAAGGAGALRSEEVSQSCRQLLPGLGLPRLGLPAPAEPETGPAPVANWERF